MHVGVGVTMAILYGILIAALMGLSAFAGAWVVLKLKTTPQWRTFKINSDDDDKRVTKEIQHGGFEAFNMEEPPPTAGEMGKRFQRSASEELKNATKK